MAGSNDFTGQNIQDTYQRVLQLSSSNQIADGTGSALPIKIEGDNVRVTGDIIAQQYVVSSSVTNITTQQLSGSTSFGDSEDDTHQLVGSVSASSIRIRKQNAEAKLALEASSQAYQSSIDFSQGGIGDLWRVGVTNSSLFKPNFVITSGSSDTLGLNNDQSFIIKGDEFKVGVGFPISAGQPTSPDLLAKFNVAGDILTSGENGHITASGDISASGKIYAEDYYINNDHVIAAGAGTTFFGRLNKKTEITGSNIKLGASVTASGNISASGTVIADKIDSNATSGNNTFETHILLAQDKSVAFGTTGEKITGDGTNLTLNADGDINLTSTTGVDITGPVTASGNISASATSTGSFGAVGIGTADPQQLLHVKGSTPKIRVEAAANGTPQIELKNNQSPDFTLKNVFSDGGFQIAATGGPKKSFVTIGANDGDVIELSGSVHISGPQNNLSASSLAIESASSHVAGMSFLTSPIVGLIIGNTHSDAYYRASDKHHYLNGRVVVGSTDFNNGAELTVNGPIYTDSHITASGLSSVCNISASGAIYGNNFYLINKEVIGESEAGLDLNIGAGPDWQRITVGDTVTINNISGNITASGGISSSGKAIFGLPGAKMIHEFYGKIKVIGSDVTIGDGHITASGNISSSGDISAGPGSTGSFDHIITQGSTIEFKDGNTKIGQLKVDDTTGFSFDLADGSDRKPVRLGDLDAKSIDGVNLTIENHITASGRISASGFIGDLSGTADEASSVSVVNDTADTSNHPILFVDSNPDGSVQTIKANADIKINPGKGQISGKKIIASGEISADTGSFEIANLGPKDIQIIAPNTSKTLHNLKVPGGYNTRHFVPPIYFYPGDQSSRFTTVRGGRPILVSNTTAVKNYYQYVIPSGMTISGVGVYASAGQFNVYSSFIGNNAHQFSLASNRPCITTTSQDGFDGDADAENNYTISSITAVSASKGNMENSPTAIYGIGQYITIEWVPGTNATLHGAVIEMTPSVTG